MEELVNGKSYWITYLVTSRRGDRIVSYLSPEMCTFLGDFFQTSKGRRYKSKVIVTESREECVKVWNNLIDTAALDLRERTEKVVYGFLSKKL